jgi:hypothetical protein
VPLCAEATATTSESKRKNRTTWSARRSSLIIETSLPLLAHRVEGAAIYKPFLTPGQQGQINALSFFIADCGLRVLASGESCSYTVVFQPGVLDDPDPDPGTVFRGRIVQKTDHGSVVVIFTATAT